MQNRKKYSEKRKKLLEEKYRLGHEKVKDTKFC